MAAPMCAGLLEHALIKDSTGELHSIAIQALLEVAADSPEQCADLYKGQLSWLKSLLSHTDATGDALCTELDAALSLPFCQHARSHMHLHR